MRYIRGSIAVVFVSVLVSCTGCNDCKDVDLGQFPSPDGRWVATMGTRECGGAEGEYVGVSIHRSADSKVKSDSYVFMVKPVGPIGISWQGNQRVYIDCHCPDSKIRKKLTKVESIEVVYGPK